MIPNQSVRGSCHCTALLLPSRPALIVQKHQFAIDDTTIPRTMETEINRRDEGARSTLIGAGHRRRQAGFRRFGDAGPVCVVQNADTMRRSSAWQALATKVD